MQASPRPCLPPGPPFASPAVPPAARASPPRAQLRYSSAPRLPGPARALHPVPRGVSVRWSRTGRRVGIAPAASRERRARRPWSLRHAAAREEPALVRCRARRRQRVRAKAAWTRESNAEPSCGCWLYFAPFPFCNTPFRDLDGRYKVLTVRRDSFHQSLSHIIIYNPTTRTQERLASRLEPARPRPRATRRDATPVPACLTPLTTSSRRTHSHR